jgi:hypothetical protein
VLLSGGASLAAEYRANEFLGLDLSQAVLSPKPLGPAAEFAPVPVQAKTDSNSDMVKSETAKTAKTKTAKTKTAKSETAESETAESETAESETKSETVKNDTAENNAVEHDTATTEVRAEPKAAPHRGRALAHFRPEKTHGAERTKLAHRQGNPLDVQAFDTRVQAWPC